MRKLARVGRPSSRAAISAVTSAGASSAPARRFGVGHQLVEDPLQLGALPALQRRGQGEQVGRRADRRRPVLDRLHAPERGQHLLQAGDQLGHPAGEVDRPALDVIERQHAAEQTPVVLGHGHAEQESFQSRLPGPLEHAGELVGRAAGRVQAPADPRFGHPVAHPGEIVVIQPEAPPDRCAVGQIEHL